MKNTIVAAALAISAFGHCAHGQAVPVKYIEGSFHGFLVLHDAAGALLAHGDLIQIGHEHDVTSRMVFYLKGSVFEESVTYTQHGAFRQETYHLIQSGPAFSNDLDASLARDGTYLVRTKSHKNGAEKTYSGKLDLPADTYNGMAITIAKNISATAPTTVHIVAFTPTPRLIGLEFTPSPAANVHFGQHEEAAVEYTLKAKLGFFLRIGAKLTGRLPADTHLWIVTDGLPAFAKSAGPLYSGPSWQITLTSPEWAK